MLQAILLVCSRLYMMSSYQGFKVLILCRPGFAKGVDARHVLPFFCCTVLTMHAENIVEASRAPHINPQITVALSMQPLIMSTCLSAAGLIRNMRAGLHFSCAFMSLRIVPCNSRWVCPRRLHSPHAMSCRPADFAAKLKPIFADLANKCGLACIAALSWGGNKERELLYSYHAFDKAQMSFSFSIFTLTQAAERYCPRSGLQLLEGG